MKGLHNIGDVLYESRMKNSSTFSVIIFGRAVVLRRLYACSNIHIMASVFGCIRKTLFLHLDSLQGYCTSHHTLDMARQIGR